MRGWQYDHLCQKNENEDGWKVGWKKEGWRKFKPITKEEGFIGKWITETE